MTTMLSEGRVSSLFIALFWAALAARLLAIWLLPPLLDVYYYDAKAVKALLGGIDPYGLAYVGVPAWLATPEATNVFAYLPGVLLFLSPFGALSDIRFGLILADFMVAWAFYLIGGERSRGIVLSFLLLPFTVLFSTSYPNNTLVAMAFFGLSAALLARGRDGAASVLLGFSLASSQFIWLIFPLLLRWSIIARRLHRVAAGVLVGMGLVLPFLLWNWSSFIYDTVVFEFTRVPRTIISSAAFGFNVNPTLDGLLFTLFGVAVPLVLRVAITVAALVVATSRVRDIQSLLFNATWFLLLAIFVLPNIVSWWYLELPLQTFLMWLAATRRVPTLTAANA